MNGATSGEGRTPRLDESPPDGFTARLFPEIVRDVRLGPPGADLLESYTAAARAYGVESGDRPRLTLTLTHASTKSAVFRASGEGRSRARKVFGDRAAFAGELLTARVTRRDPAFLRLLGWSERLRVLEYEWLGSVGTVGDPEEYVRHLARVHTVHRRLPAPVARLVRRTARVPRALPAAVARAEAGRLPAGFVWCAVLDQKAAHCARRDPSGPPVQLDLESLTFGVSGLLDLAAVPAMLSLDPGGAVWRECLAAYAEESRAHGLELPLGALLRMNADLSRKEER